MEKQEILEILNDWNFWNKDIESGIERKTYIDEIKRKANTKEIIVANGIRRCGKSTILMQYCKNLINLGVKKNDILIINFEDPRFRELSLDLLNKIYETYLTVINPSKEHYVILDEIQSVNEWEKFARFLYENKKINVFVTGSNSKLLSSEFSSVLTGRHLDIHIEPLSFNEFLVFKKIFINSEQEITAKRHELKRALAEYIKWGGFPKVVLSKEEKDKKELLDTYFKDILIKDIVIRNRLKNPEKIEELAKYYMTNISSVHSLNKIKNMLGISLESVQRFSYYLSEVFLLSFVPKFSWKKKEQILNPKKVYCSDIGIRNTVSFLFKEDYGRIAENLVYNKLMQDGYEVFYWKNKNELDFIIKDNKKIEAIQVCWNIGNVETKEREMQGLLEACKELKLTNGLIITEDLLKEEKINGIKIIYEPLWRFLLTNKK